MSTFRRGVTRLKERAVPFLTWGGVILGGGLLFTHHFYSWHATFGPSMYPTMVQKGQWAITSRAYRHGKGLRVGDLVMYKNPLLRETATKRVLGMPGDFVCKDAPAPSWQVGKGDGEAEMIRVPEGHIWVVGDNLPWSRDSRTYGPIPMGLVTGKVIMRGKSFYSAGWLRNTLEPAKFSDD
ncbi:signal peptidase I [Helicocarpus griseus UAMH5409]|uniref:Mitochondrial inner membrane protease subunit n=1 Tax=Helicocarpus griseus UAMH5409 TaxID=1447875 RepID=A0A2B7XHN4_9EURO|nr:signal peptidase I [Helicocarpus griseus UAMH5409]